MATDTRWPTYIGPDPNGTGNKIIEFSDRDCVPFDAIPHFDGTGTETDRAITLEAWIIDKENSATFVSTATVTGGTEVVFRLPIEGNTFTFNVVYGSAGKRYYFGDNQTTPITAEIAYTA